MKYFISALLVLSLIACTQQRRLKPDEYINNILNINENPGTSFFEYSSGGWQKANPIPEEYSKYGVDTKLYENNIVQIRDLIINLGASEHKEGSIEQKIGDLYNMCIDSVKRNSDGATPLLNDLSKIEDAKTLSDILKISGEIRSYAADPFFGISVQIDEKNSSEYLVYLSQASLGMGNRSYYLNDDSKDLRNAYIELIKNQFINAGYNKNKANDAASNIMKLETSLAKTNYPKEKLRVPENNYNKINVSELENKVASLDWNTIFSSAGYPKFQEVNIGQLQPVIAAVKLIKSTPIEELKQYLSWCVIRSGATNLSDVFYDTRFNFYGKVMQGRKQPPVRWKRAVSSVENSMGEALGQMYVQKYFPESSKQKMLQLVNNLKLALGERIEQSKWMSDTTKEKAKEKLQSFIIKIGYPDKFRDYSDLEISKDNFYSNMKKASAFEYKRDINKLGKPVDKTEWEMTPQTVNAYYNPTTNEICFPAGILQAPFFYPNADDAINYGAIGAVIGHEMTHGFDDQGSQYDKDGNLKNWWTESDAKNFKERTKVLEDFFNNIVVIDTLHANGTYTLGENIADQGGLQIAYTAFQKTQQAKENKSLYGFTPAQRFFISYGLSWAENIRDKAIISQTKSDPHALSKWRVDGALPHIDEWYKAFNITEKDSLFIPKEKRVNIW